MGSLVGGVLAVVLVIGLKLGIAGGVAGIFHIVDNKTSDAALASVGDCVQVTDKSLTTVKVTTLGCGDPAASYKVGARIGNAGGSCPDGDYIKITDTNLGNDYLLCLALNVTTGDCVQDEATKTPVKVACGPAATYKVGPVVTGATDRSVCGPGSDDTNTMFYPKPNPVVMCLEPVDQ
ncbi:hypothetical protein EBN03_10360 [Nocardia stercoris]|uniref:Uncharacterized protein n=1 Tax=Nocardia stercoris TaxID=2483361 RepID=A0A3M2L819_9NOCA|nr:hypothetical protein EBN03_10360 [Nocardia stercoris]